MASLWEQQWNDLQELRSQEDLDDRSFFFLLHLLIGLGPAPNDKTADYVGRLTRTRTPTEAYPEETFINQLTYLALMYLGDPQEPDEQYGLDDTARIALFTELQSITLGDQDRFRCHPAKPHPPTPGGTKGQQLPVAGPGKQPVAVEAEGHDPESLLNTFKAVPLEVPDFLWRGKLPGQSAMPGKLSDEERAALNTMISSMIF